MNIPFLNLTVSIKRNDVGQPKGRYTQKGQAPWAGLLESQGTRVAPQNLWAIYRLNADVYGCIRELRQSVGDGGNALVSAKDPEIEPDPTTKSFVEYFWDNSGGLSSVTNLAVRDLGICGNAYFEIVIAASGKQWGLKRLDPRTIFIVANKYGQILKYFQRVEGGDAIEFDPNQIFHLMLEKDPDNELLGFPNLETALWEARTDIAAAETNYFFFENDAVPSVLYITESGTTEDEEKAALEGIKSQFGGAKNRNKAGMLSGIKEVKVLSMSQKDMEFVVGRKFNTDKVCSVYGVPKFLLGYSETVNYSSGAKLLEKFYRGTVQPIENSIQNQINTQLFVKIGIADKVQFKFLPQNFGEEAETIRLALEELSAGAITLRQYKVKTGQKVTPEDEDEALIDKHIIHAGASAVLYDDVGVDPVADPNNPEAAQNMIKALENKFLKYDE